MPKSVGTWIPIEEEVLWFLEIKKEYSEKLRLNYLK